VEQTARIRYKQPRSGGMGLGVSVSPRSQWGKTQAAAAATSLATQSLWAVRKRSKVSAALAAAGLRFD